MMYILNQIKGIVDSYSKNKLSTSYACLLLYNMKIYLLDLVGEGDNLQGHN